MRARAVALGLAAAALLLACLVLRPGPTGGPPLRDFEAYAAGGAAWAAGADPYGTAVWAFERAVPGVVASRDELLPFVGPPFGLWLWAPLAAVPYASAAVLWSVLLALALATLVFGSLRLAGRKLDALDIAAAALFCGGFGPTISALALGQVALLASGAVVAALLLLGEGPQGLGERTARLGEIVRFAGAALATLVAALQPNLAIVLAARLRDARSALALGTAAAGAYALSALALHDVAWPLRYLALLREHGAAERGVAIQTTAGGVAQGFGLEPAAAVVLGGAVALAVAAAVVVQLARGRFRPVAGTALAAAALPLALPFGHEHDFAIVLLPALMCLARARARMRAAVIAATLLAGVDWLGLAQRPTGAAETVAMTLAAGLALAALATPHVRPLELVPAGAGALAVAAAALMAGGHAVPMWPDGLGLDWHASPALASGAASAARVWGQEQAAAGLAGTNPAAAFLRLLSLLGCAAIWICASRVLAEPAPRRAAAAGAPAGASRFVAVSARAAAGD